MRWPSRIRDALTINLPRAPLPRSAIVSLTLTRRFHFPAVLALAFPFTEVTDELDTPSWQRFVGDIIGIEVECLAEMPQNRVLNYLHCTAPLSGGNHRPASSQLFAEASPSQRHSRRPGEAVYGSNAPS
jgi:hypothetical protein